MKIAITELIVLQAKAVAVMFCAGIVTQTLWQIKIRIKHRALAELIFWPAAALILCKFLYYCAFGKLTLYSAAGFFAGLLLWKKICCGILKEVWVEKDEAENLRTTAKSSTSIRPESKGWKKGVQKRRRKKKK